MPRPRLARVAPGLVGLLVVLLVALSVGSSWMVARHFRREAMQASRVFSIVFGGLNSTRPGSETEALLRLGDEVRSLGIPVVVTDDAGRVTAAANLPFDAPLDDPRVRRYATELDRIHPPLREPNVGTVHFGQLPVKRQVTVLTALQALDIVVMVAVAVYAFRSAVSAQRDRLWVAMAREAAHQMGTPLTSLQGWIELLRSPRGAPPELPDHLQADAERLDRVARRFERIGNPARREPVGLGALADRVAAYYRPRLPKHANQVELRVEAPGAGPTVTGDPVLLEWALEALVKNAVDALQGRGGTIILRAANDGDRALLSVADDGPGVPKEMRRSIFLPGTTTKARGWGIGLALARRVVEDQHGGELELAATDEGAMFVMRMPQATGAAA